MKLLTLTCQHCGAPLEVPSKIAQLTCQFCGTRLQVQRTGSAAYTEAVGEVAQRMAQVADETQRIRFEQEIARLDREWQLGRERFMVRGKSGQLNIPDKTPLVIAAGLIIIFGVFWTIFAGGIATAMSGWMFSNVGGPLSLLPGVFPCLGVLWIVLGLVSVISAWRKAGDFEMHQLEYHAARSRLLAELNAATGTAKAGSSIAGASRQHVPE